MKRYLFPIFMIIVLTACGQSKEKQLLRTVENGDYYNSATLIVDGANVNCRAKNGDTPIIIAAKNLSWELVAALLQSKADPNLQNNEGQNALMACITTEHTDETGVSSERQLSERRDKICQTLLPVSNLKLKTKKGLTTLQLLLSTKNRLTLLNRFLGAGAFKANSDSLEVIDYILCEPSKDMQLKYEMMEKFLSAGYTLPATGNQFTLAIENAATLPMLNLLLDYHVNLRCGTKTGTTPLYFAVGMGDLPLVKRLLSSGVEINEHSYNGNTPLHGAVLLGYPEMVTYLLSQGAEVNSQNNDGVTPLIFAMERNVTLAKILMEHGADINLAAKNGDTPLLKAAQQNNAELISFLLKQHADPNAKVAYGWNAVRFVTHKKALLTLLDAGIESDLLDNNKRNALMDWAERDDLDAVKALLKHHATAALVDANSKSALYYAAKNGNLEMVKILLQNKGGDVLKNKEHAQEIYRVTGYLSDFLSVDENGKLSKKMSEISPEQKNLIAAKMQIYKLIKTRE